MARIETSPIPAARTHISSRQHFATIAWLRWRIFVNSLRGKGATGELVARIISYPFLAVMIVGPSIGAGVASYYLVNHDNILLLAIPFWIIFALWQFVGVNTSATGPSFDLSTLIRFPLRYRDYLLIRLSFGLMDAPTLAGIACLFASCLGIALASPRLFPWSALVLAFYAACNILFSRMIYTWIERWLAQRRTRELVTGVILACSLGIQFAAQFAQRLGGHGRHAPPNTFLVTTAHVLISANWLLPPGLAASSIDHVHRGTTLIAATGLGGLVLYAAGFLFILHLRLRAEFLGENLSQAPAAAKASANKSAAVKVRAAQSTSVSLLPAAISACLVKEVRYLLRSGPKLYALIMPVFLVFLFSIRTSGLDYAGVTRHGVQGILFTYGCAYTQLIFVSLIYNSLGSEGAGIQFYFLAPLRMRDVMAAKNILTLSLFAIEAILLYIVSMFISSPAQADLATATIAWSLFALLLNMSIGNLRSITAPRVLDTSKVRSQNVGGVSSLISIVVVFSSIALGALAYALCAYLNTGFWIAAIIFFLLATAALVLYLQVLRRIDSIAAVNVENLTRVLGKV